jgi:succinylglutamic semialdehyde dehydrogenase
VFKPSEVAPAVGVWMAERWREAGLPDGVLEVVQGGPITGRALALADVDGILFTGSYPTGRALIQATLDAPHKLLALELGGSNAVIVCADADLDLAVSECALSIAATTGQRCTAARRIFVERPLRERFQEKLAAVLTGLRVGAPLDEGVFMGPLASLEAHARLEAMRGLAEAAGGERVLRVESHLPPPYTGAGLVRFESIEQRHPYQREEIFGPEAALYPVDDLDEAIAAANDSDYGLAASVITRSRAKYERCVGRIRTGVLNWNKGTIGASARLPFGGSGKSGNDRPAGVTATLYCTAPQAHLESDAGFDASTLPPGMPRP